MFHLIKMMFFDFRLRNRVVGLCVKVCQLLAVGWWFPPGDPVSPTSETDISLSSPPRYDLGCC